LIQRYHFNFVSIHYVHLLLLVVVDFLVVDVIVLYQK